MALRTLNKWELSEYWRFPWLELFLFINVLLFLERSPSPLNTTSNDVLTFLLADFPLVTLFQIVTTSVVFSRSVAFSLEDREMVVLLSEPISRRTVFFNKFATSFGMLVVLNSISLAALVFVLPPQSGITILAALQGIILRLFFLSTISMSLCLLLKGQASSILAGIMVPSVYEYFLSTQSSNLRYFSLTGYFRLTFAYLTAPTGRFILGGPTPGDIALSVAVLALMSVILFSTCYIYFVNFMEVD